MSAIWNDADFLLYARSVINHMRKNPQKYPAISELMTFSYDEESLDMITVGIAGMCAWHFRRSHVITLCATDLETCVREGRMNAQLVLSLEGATVH